MNRAKEMDEFLKWFAKLYYQNPNYPISKNMLYSYLATYGLSQSELQDRNIEANFEIWQNHYKNNPNLHVFYTEKQPGFLQFQSYTDMGFHQVKLYLSFSKEHMEDCVNTIFSYIASQNMKTFSKVANKVRSDSVVLRMTNIEDALKVIQYINSVPSLNMYAKQTNPFIMRVGKVGVAYDNRISYNETLALLLEQYFLKCRQDNNLKKVSRKHFLNYVKQFHMNTFRNPNQLRQFANSPQISKLVSKFQNIGAALTNYDYVIQLIGMSLDEKMSMQQFIDFHREASDMTKNNQMTNYYNSFLQNDYHNSIGNNVKQNDDEMKRKILNEYIDLAIQKYGEHKVGRYLEEYVSGHSDVITRECDFRKKFATYLSTRKVLELTNYDVTRYVQNYIQEKKQSTVMVDNSSFELVMNACKATYQKYGYRQLKEAIEKGCSGLYDYFTNGNGKYRSQLQSSVSAQQFTQYCQQIIRTYGDNIAKTNDFYECCTKAIENMVLGKYNTIEENNHTLM